MKKFVAILLCVAMLMVGVVAQAESGYEYVKAYLQDEFGLGEGWVVTLDKSFEEYTLIIISLDFTNYEVSLIGDNAQDEFEATTWFVDDSDFVKLVRFFCESYSDILEKSDEGYGPVIYLQNGGDDSIIITSPEQAAAILAIIDKN